MVKNLHFNSRQEVVTFEKRTYFSIEQEPQGHGSLTWTQEKNMLQLF